MTSGTSLLHTKLAIDAEAYALDPEHAPIDGLAERYAPSECRAALIDWDQKDRWFLSDAMVAHIGQCIHRAIHERLRPDSQAQKELHLVLSMCPRAIMRELAMVQRPGGLRKVMDVEYGKTNFTPSRPSSPLTRAVRRDCPLGPVAPGPIAPDRPPVWHVPVHRRGD